MMHKHLLEDNLDWLAQYRQMSLEAIRSNKKLHYHPNDLLNPHTANVAEMYGLRHAIN